MVSIPRTASTSVPKRNLLKCGGVQDRWQSGSFVGDSGCIDLSEFGFARTRSGLFHLPHFGPANHVVQLMALGWLVAIGEGRSLWRTTNRPVKKLRGTKCLRTKRPESAA